MKSKVKWIFAMLGLFTLGAAMTAVGQQNKARTETKSNPERAAGGPRGGAGPQTANISIEIAGPATASFGTPADYELIVRNHGSTPVENVRVEAELPHGSEIISAVPPADVESETATWIIERLDGTREQRIKMQLNPKEEGTLECHAIVTCMAMSAVQTKVTRPQLVLTMTGPDEVVAGRVAKFVLKISNPGTGTATGVVVRDLVPAGLDHPAGNEIEYEVGSLPPGSSREVQLELVAKVGGPQTNHAQVTADGDLRAVAESTVRVLEPQLAIKKVGPKRRYLERPATYSIEVSNPGSAPASRVSITDELPDGLVLVEASDGGRLGNDKRAVHWAFEELEAGDSRTVTLTVRPTVAGEFVTQSVAKAEGGLQAEAEAVTTVEGISALVLEIVDLDDPVEAGSETTYEIRVINRGSQAATNVVIQATAPKGMRPIKAEAPVGYEIQGQDIIFEPLPRLGVRADAAYHVRVAAEKPGDLRFRVSLHSDQLESAVNKEESTRVYSDQ